MMTEIFRGLLDILHKHNDSLHKDLVSHIRKFDRKTDEMEENEIEIGVYGFWRLMLEQATGFYLWIMSGMGLSMILILAVLSFPLRLMIGAVSLMLKTSSRYQTEFVEPNLNEPAAPAAPANDNREVVRRVVYEEAKVAKGQNK